MESSISLDNNSSKCIYCFLERFEGLKEEKFTAQRVKRQKDRIRRRAYLVHLGSEKA